MMAAMALISVTEAAARYPLSADHIRRLASVSSPPPPFVAPRRRSNPLVLLDLLALLFAFCGRRLKTLVRLRTLG